MILLIERGHSQEVVLGMDFLSFQALLEGSNRVNAALEVRNAWTMMHAAQGTSKGMTKALKPLMSLITGETYTPPNDEAAFLKKHPRGL